MSLELWDIYSGELGTDCAGAHRLGVCGGGRTGQGLTWGFLSQHPLTAQGNGLGTERGPWMYGSPLDLSFSIYKTGVLVVECRHSLANGFVAEVGNEVKG